MQIVDVYGDAAESGSHIERAARLRLLADARRGRDAPARLDHLPPPLS
jgi:hypothetical protein